MKKFALFIVLVTAAVARPTDSEILAATLILEAGGEKDPRAMDAVNETITTRSVKRKISKVSVVLQPKQFSCWNKITPESGVARAKKHSRFKEALRIVNRPPTRFTSGADHYHTTSVKPSWAKKLRPVTVIGAHIFYK